MNSLDRCLRVMRQQSVDRVPVVPQGFLFAIEQARIKMGAATHDPKLMADALLKCWEQYRYDGIVIDFDDATLAEACGAKVIFREDEPAIVDEEFPVISNWDELDKLILPDPLSTGRLPVWLETTRILADQIGDEVLIMGRADQGPFSVASLLRGTQNFMMDLMIEDPEKIHKLVAFCTEAFIRFAKAQKEAGAHITSLGDALAGPNLISPELYQTFAWEPEKKIVRDLKACDIPFSIHICGDTTSILDQMIQTGADVLEIDWEVDITEATRKSKRQSVIMGNLNPSQPMVTGSKEEVNKATKEILEKTGGENLWLSTGCAMGRNTPPQNFKAFMQAARDF